MCSINMNSAMRTCVITGANSGIGKSAAHQLADKDWRVIMVCRNLAKAQNVCDIIKNETGNEQVFVMQADMSLTADIKRFTSEYKRKFDTLDVLINNAADFDLSRKKPLITAEGNEVQFATNLLAPFMLGQTLLPLLRQSKDGRIINISSRGLIAFPNIKFDFDNIRAEKSYSPAKTYYQTKLGLLMLSLMMQRRLADYGVAVYAVRVTNVRLDLARYPNISPILKAMYRIKSCFSISPDDMAKVYVALAAGERKEGLYYDEKMREVKCNKNAYNRKAQERLWGLCEYLTSANAADG